MMFYPLWFNVLAGGVVRGATEAIFALVVRAVIAVGLTIVPPEWREKWDHFGWRNGVIFAMSFIVVPLLLYGLSCWGGVPIPSYAPRCDFSGLIMDAFYPGFLAFLFNYVGEDMWRHASRRKKRASMFINSLWFGLIVTGGLAVYVIIRLL